MTVSDYSQKVYGQKCPGPMVGKNNEDLNKHEMSKDTAKGVSEWRHTEWR